MIGDSTRGSSAGCQLLRLEVSSTFYLYSPVHAGQETKNEGRLRRGSLARPQISPAVGARPLPAEFRYTDGEASPGSFTMEPGGQGCADL